MDENIAARYASLRLELKKIGRPIPEHDIWIAAICLEYNVTLLSRDGHFDYIPDLKLINWAKL